MESIPIISGNYYHIFIGSNNRDNIVSINVSEQFYRLLNAFTQAINKRNHSTGSLFQKSFKRKLIKSKDDYWNLFSISIAILCTMVYVVPFQNILGRQMAASYQSRQLNLNEIE